MRTNLFRTFPSRCLTGIAPLPWFCFFLLVIPTISFAQVSFERVRSFGFLQQLGTSPNAGVIEGSDGRLYGTTYSGGQSSVGVVYRVSKDGTGYSTLYQFTGTNGDGSHPVAEVLEASDGALYGTTRDAGTNDNGTVFKINKDGSGYTHLLRFDGGAQGSSPNAALIELNDGKLYGSGNLGGSAGFGNLFRLSKNGSNFEVLHNFTGSSTDGKEPVGRLLKGSDGALYGTTYRGGTNGQGVVFKINPDGTGFSVLHSFVSATDGQNPFAGLVEGSDHLLYGTASAGGTYGQGTLFSVATNGASFAVLHHFGPNGGDGQEPVAGLVQGPGGALYGSTFTGGDFINGLIFKINPNGSGYAILHQFNGGVKDEGYRPEGVLWLSGDGAFYGTTSHGGLANVGTLFKMNADGSGYARLRSCTRSGGDAATLYARMFQAGDGALYGMSTDGGAYEAGAAFKLNSDGSGYSILHSFSWETDDASNPYGTFVEGNGGALYGTTGYGGGSNMGTIFKINKDGSGYNILRRFTGVVGTGAHPSTGLLAAGDGKFYGRLTSGGDGDAAALYRVNNDGSNFAIVFSFDQTGDFLSSPDPNLIEGADGALYSANYGDGPTYDGTVWKVNKDGTAFQVLHTFSETNGDGYLPDGGLLQDKDGTLYGTTSSGGTFDGGTVFKLNPDGSGYAIVHHFNPTNSDGSWPKGDLLAAPGGILLGVTYQGGINNYGVIYALGTNGSHYTVLRRLNQSDGTYPTSLTGIRDGAIYGTAAAGGDLDLGTLFRMPCFKVGGYALPAAFHLTISGSTGQLYAVDAADGLPVVWSQIGTLTNLTGTAELIDPRAAHTKRWYRARWLLP